MNRVLAASATLAVALLPFPAAAEVDHLYVQVRETVAGGRPFGLAGPYEKLAGKVHFSLDPGGAANRAIVDLDRAPRGDDGRVHFTADFYVLKPVEAKRGNGAVFLEVPNRGGKAIVRYFHRGAGRSFDPVAAADLGDGFLLRRGYTLAWVGWQWDVRESDDLLRLDPVFATAVTGPTRSPMRTIP